MKSTLEMYARRLKSRLGQFVRRLLGLQLTTTPAIHCETLKLGGPAYGSWTICPNCINRGGLVYSFGVGEDIKWDLAMIERFGVTVHAFDPTPRSINWVKQQTLPDNFIFHEYGIAAYDGLARFYPPENPEWVSHTLLDRQATAKQSIEVPVRCLKTIMSDLEHERVDLIKMDIEGAEYKVVGDMLNAIPPAGGAKQILIEFHHRFVGKGVGPTSACIRALKKNGFHSFFISSSTEDWSFVRYG